MNYWPQYIVAEEQGFIKAVFLNTVYNETHETKIWDSNAIRSTFSKRTW